jgi:hypothetical protein
MNTAARFAGEWHVWATPDQFHHKCRVLDDHCMEIGRDPATIQRSTGGSLLMSTDPEQLAGMRDLEPSSIIGMPGEIVELVDAYQVAGANDFIVRDAATLPADRTVEMLSLFVTEVALELQLPTTCARLLGSR